jgi:uncharacterized protein YbjT (DUF2867 family)
VAPDLQLRGHHVRVLSRRTEPHRVDLATGEGLAAALSGCDVVIDVSNAAGRKAPESLVEGARRLLAAEQAAGVRHHVCVSVVGCELMPAGYFLVKADQERVVEQGPVPWTIVRATQFHELVAATLSRAGRAYVVPVPRVALQPVACAEVGYAVASAAESAPRYGRIEVAGPEVTDAMTLARTWRSVTGLQVALVRVPLPGKAGRALRAGALISRQPDTQGIMPFATWLTAGSGRHTAAA